MMGWLNKLFKLNGKRANGVWLSEQEQRVLAAVHNGQALRSHRNIEGEKVFKLHGDGAESAEIIARKTVMSLRQKRLIETNHKFPTATYLLTGHGVKTAADLTGHEGSHPIAARDFVRDNQ